MVLCILSLSLSLSHALFSLLTPSLLLLLPYNSFYPSVSFIFTHNAHTEVTSKGTSTNDIASNNILSTLQLSDIVQSAAVGGAGATAESILQSVVNLVGAAQLQSVTAATTSAESAATATPATAEDTGKGG